MALTDAAHRGWEDNDFERHQIAAADRFRRRADIAAGLDLIEARLQDFSVMRGAGESDRHIRAAPRMYGERVTADRGDSATHVFAGRGGEGSGGKGGGGEKRGAGDEEPDGTVRHGELP